MSECPGVRHKTDFASGSDYILERDRAIILFSVGTASAALSDTP